ncbi:MAG: hypothetical protein WC209_11610 [Ignavibacteriaceae bacterium]|jgi:hypothetical protein
MNEIHLNYLIEIGENDQGYVGNNSLKWGNSVLGPNVNIDPFLDRQFNRYDLFAYRNNPANSHVNVLIAVLSWGGMRRDHGRLLFRNLNHVLNLVENLRSGIYQTRQIAFEEFRQNRTMGLLPGLGIGYFTKLICFLAPDLNGYIMDQWVSKSINLLTGEQIVNLTNNSWVNDNNDGNTYEIFCNHIDNLAQLLNCSGFEAEKRIFSVGRGNGLWRNYLIQNYNNY